VLDSHRWELFDHRQNKILVTINLHRQRPQDSKAWKVIDNYGKGIGSFQTLNVLENNLSLMSSFLIGFGWVKCERILLNIILHKAS
jgi:hypothetical protein